MQKDRRRLLPSQRGTAVLEGVVVIAMLAALLAVGAFFHRRHVATLALAREARSAAWTSAIAGCSRNLKFSREVAGLITRELPKNPYAVVTGRTPLTVDGDPQLISRAAGASGTVVVPCGEQVHLDGLGIHELEDSLVRTLLMSF